MAIKNFRQKQRISKLGALVSKVVTPACQQQGFVQASILLDWIDIVGAQFAQLCQPEKVAFPLHQRRMGQLFIRVPSAIAPEIIYLEPQILSKINRYFGYQAVSRLVIRQGPLTITKPQKQFVPKQATPQQQINVDAHLNTIDDDDLRQALFNLGCGIMSHDCSQ